MKNIIQLGLCLVLILASVQFGFAEQEKHKIGSGPHAGNCVEYLRSKGIKFPHGLYTYNQKLAIINKHKPKKGRIAIIRIPSGEYAKYGHVALVTKVDDNGKKQSITLEESNYPTPGYWVRKITGKNIKEVEKEAHIAGYYDP